MSSQSRKLTFSIRNASMAPGPINLLVYVSFVADTATALSVPATANSKGSHEKHPMRPAPWAILKPDSMPAIAVSACSTALMDSAQIPQATPSPHRCPLPLLPFLPRACIGGTGDGNLAGLCDFACNLGFCPINACICTAEGALHTLPEATGKVGEAGQGMDEAIYGPLCAFTCKYEYCPQGACAVSTSLVEGVVARAPVRSM